MLLDRTSGGEIASRTGSTDQSRPEWFRYQIRIPQPTQRRHQDGIVLTEVHHVAHIPEARRILEDKRIRTGLVYDESRLNRSRTCVVWASANVWPSLGSIYGNVQFAFDWSDILGNRKVYWVEAMPGYNPDAYRLLLTDRDLDPGVARKVVAYDPSVDKGPLRERDGTPSRYLPPPRFILRRSDGVRIRDGWPLPRTHGG
jgi:hypothetical protein